MAGTRRHSAARRTVVSLVAWRHGRALESGQAIRGGWRARASASLVRRCGIAAPATRWRLRAGLSAPVAHDPVRAKPGVGDEQLVAARARQGDLLGLFGEHDPVDEEAGNLTDTAQELGLDDALIAELAEILDWGDTEPITEADVAMLRALATALAIWRWGCRTTQRGSSSGHRRPQ